MNSHPNALPIPPAVIDDPHAHEIMRFWTVNGETHVAYPAQWGDPSAWELVVFTSAEFIAARNERHDTHTSQETLEEMKRIFDFGVEDRRRKQLSS